VVANNGRPPEDIVANYSGIWSVLVNIDEENLTGYEIIAQDILINYDKDHNHSELNRAKWVWQHVGLHYIRHDSDVVGNIVQWLL
jgi:hypothetical protein